MKTFKYKAAGLLILFFSIVFTFSLINLLNYELILIIGLSILIFSKNIKSNLKLMETVIENILTVSWIIILITLIKTLSQNRLSLNISINIALFISISYISNYILKKIYIHYHSKNLNKQQNLKRYNFTNREHELITLLIEGKKYKEIASDLFISENTVKKHISNIYSKASVNNKVELIYKLSKN